MTNRERRRTIRARVMDGIEQAIAYQVCPNTFVKVTAIINGEQYQACGFAKVRWPDIWDAKFGIACATKKAIVRIVRAVAKDEAFEEEPILVDLSEVFPVTDE